MLELNAFNAAKAELFLCTSKQTSNIYLGILPEFGSRLTLPNHFEYAQANRHGGR